MNIPIHVLINLRLLILSLLCLLAGAALAQDDQVGIVSQIQGRVDVVRGTEAPAAMAQGDAVLRSDALITGDDSLVEVQFSDGSSFTLDENAQVTIAEYAPGAEPQGLLELTRGRLRSRVSDAFSNREDSYKVATREGVMGVQGTEFEVIARLRETAVYVYSGVVSATSQDPAFPEPMILRAGDFLSFGLGEPLPPPTRFMRIIDESSTANADGAIGSGGEQAIISGGDQSVDPTAPAPAMSDQPSGANGMAPPPPRPPSGGGSGG